LEEEVQDDTAAKSRQLLRLAFLRACERARGREDPLDVLAREVAHGEQVAPRAARRRRQQLAADEAQVGHVDSSSAGINTTRSTSSTSTSSTWIRSSCFVGRFLPT